LKKLKTFPLRKFIILMKQDFKNSYTENMLMHRGEKKYMTGFQERNLEEPILSLPKEETVSLLPGSMTVR